MRKFFVFVLTVFFSLQSFAAATDVVKQMLERSTGNSLENLKLKLTEDEELDWFRVSTEKGVATIEANSLSAASYGAYQYLRDTGAFAYSWEGRRVAIPRAFSDLKLPKTHSLVRDRVYLNVCAYGYTTPWWGWERWEKEIDWMALHGVNMPVAMEGQEYIWKKLWLEFGATEEQLADYFSGPAFTPWQRMGNIEGHGGPLSNNWIEKKHQLQLKILKRMRALGMKPIAPAFGGYVPSFIAEKFPKARIVEMEPWTGFDKLTHWLDPKDPLFTRIAKRFIELHTETYGESEYYLSDSFNEMLPPVSKENRYEELSDYGRYIYESITQVVPQATWVMQGWMFGADKEFWDSKSIAAFLSKVPNEKAMVHDIGNDRYAVWEGADAFFGKPWVLGFIHNYGGSNPVYGNFDFYDKTFLKAYHSKEKGAMLGYGVFPEGINNNSVVYEYLFDVPWSDHKADFSSWIKSYNAARYGISDPALEVAWSMLEESVFSTEYWKSRWWKGSAGAYVFFKRPQLELIEFGEHPSDAKKLRSALSVLVKQQAKYKDSPLYTYDVIEFTRHYATLSIDKLIKQTLVDYSRGDKKAARKKIKKIKKLAVLTDRLLGGQEESLATWVSSASEYAESHEEALAYIRNAKQQISTWGGPKLKDYASKSWQGMYGGFYLQRWLQFFNALDKSTKTNDGFNIQAFEQSIVVWESKWASNTELPEASVPKRPLKLIKEILSL